MTNFWNGFEKQSAKLFRRLPGRRDIVLVGGKHPGRSVANLALYQAKKLIKTIGGPKALDQLKQRGKSVAGAAVKNRVYARADLGKDLRGVIHHEAFHAKVPVLGRSEILAHFYGGLKSKKGKLSLSEGLKEIGHLGDTRPHRLMFEALPASAGLGAYIGTKQRKAREKRQAEAKHD